jgi:hypothetical protein
MEHGPGCHQVVSAVFNRVFEDIELPDFEVGYNEASDVARVNVGGNDMTAGRNPVGQPLRHRTVATSNLEAAPPGLKTKLLNMAAVQRVEQFRHQSQPLPLTSQVVRQNVLIHIGASLIVISGYRVAKDKSRKRVRQFQDMVSSLYVLRTSLQRVAWLQMRGNTGITRLNLGSIRLN